MSDMLSHFTIKLGGSDAPAEMMDDLAEVIVETNLHLPAMFIIKLYDVDVRWIDSNQLEIGTEVEIAAQEPGGSSAGTLIKGEITALEPDFDPATPTLQVRGFDRGHRLHRGRYRKAFIQVSDSDLASTIAGQHGLGSDISSTSEVYEHVYQSNLTDWEFLQERAKRIGFDCYIQDNKLVFKPSGQSQEQVELEWGEELKRFHPRLSSSGQVKEVIVQGWDPTAKSAIVGRANTSTAHPEVAAFEQGSSVASKVHEGNAQMVIVDRPVHTQGEADAMAQAIADDLSGNYIRADGQAKGNPQLRSGSKINVRAVGDRFSGTYYVTRATHIYTPKERYVVNFSVTGRRPLSLGSVLAGGSGHGRPESRVPGVTVGLVTNNDDSDNQGRVKVKLPWMDEDTESTWARIVSPMAGAGRGIYWLPEVNDEVLVAFEHNDINYPYIIGALWNGQDAPPEGTGTVINGGMVDQRIIKTRVGHLIVLDDSDSQPGITVIDKTGKNKVLIDSKENKITIQADGDILIKAQGNITIDSEKKVAIKGQTGVEITTPQKLSAKGDRGVTVESTADVDVKATGQANIKGSIVNIN